MNKHLMLSFFNKPFIYQHQPAFHTGKLLTPIKAASILLLLAINVCLFAQAPSKQWGKVVGGTNNDDAFAIAPAANNGFLVGGTSDSGISGSRTAPQKGVTDFWIVRLATDGNPLWDKAYGGSATNGLQALIPTSDGGFLLGGYSSSGVSGDKTQASRGGTDFWIVKIDASGNKLWDKTFGGTGNETITSLLPTSDGGYLLAGSSDSGIGGDKSQASRGGTDFWVVKITAAGTKQWDKTFGGNSRDDLKTAITTLDGGYLLGGISESGQSGDKAQPSRGGTDYWVVKLFANGSEQWDLTFGGASNPDPFEAGDLLYSLLSTTDGGYLLGGYSNSAP